MELLSLCVLLFLANSCLAAENCDTGGENCECTTTDGLKLDISDYFKYPVGNIPQEGEDWTYTYSPCLKFVCEESQGSRSRMCQRGDGVVNNCSSNIKSWVINSRSPLSFTITYDGGSDGRQSTVIFQYETGDNKFEFVSGQGGVYTFTVTGKGVAPYAPPPPPFTRGHGINGGVVAAAVISIILIAIIAMVAYCVIGGLIKYYHYGARGVEIIPNYTFWKDLKTGVLVATTCTSCYKTERGDYQKLP